MPKLSIITINLNNGIGLKKTILSVIQQKFKDYEFIVIDGESKDSSIAVITEFEKYFTSWISEKDTGVYNAMNKGILKASGEYCLFLNSGDFLVDSEVLLKAFAVIENESIIFFRRYFLSKKGKRKLERALSTNDINFSYLLNGTFPHQAALIKTELFKIHGSYNENFRIISDWCFWVDTLILADVSVIIINLPFVCQEYAGISSNIETAIDEKSHYLSNIKELDKKNWIKIIESTRFQQKYSINLNNFLSRFLMKTAFLFAKVINKITSKI